MAEGGHQSSVRSLLAKLDALKKTRATDASLDRRLAFGSLSSTTHAGSVQHQDGERVGSAVSSPLSESSTIISKNPTTVGSTPMKRARQAIPPTFDILISEPCNDEHDSIPAIPTSVECRMEVFLDGAKCRLELASNLKWPDPNSYTTLSALMEKGLRDIESSQVFEVRRVTLARGDLTLFRIINVDSSEYEAEIEHRVFSHGRQLGDAISVMVSNFLVACPYTPFYLEIRYQFGSVLNPTTDKTHLMTRMREAMSSSYDWRQYLPRSELERIISEDQIRELVYADSQLCQTMASVSVDELIHKILQHGIHLFALCVWTETPFTVLETLLERNLRDLHLPLGRENRHSPVGKTLDNIEDFNLAQNHFCVLDFSDGGVQEDKHYDVPVHQTVPVYFKDPEDKVGEGSFAQVFKATIHSSHHSFTSTRSHCFAVKRFRKGPNTEADFVHEREVMRLLNRAPNNNIVTHFASWTHRENFFMLFPLARTNLASYLRTKPPQQPNKRFAFWLLKQLTNLAEGLEHIHNLTDAETSSTRLLDDTGGKNFGCHYDLKPANILIFRSGQDDVWKIGDFGAARISREIKPWHENSDGFPLGDKVYEPPDWLLCGATSGSYDIWSLGCIFLEVLVWLFWNLPGQGNGEFEKRRKVDGARSKPPAYWRQNPGQTGVALRPSVVMMMRMLENQMQGFFRQVAITTIKMLNPDPKWRTDVPSMKSTLIAAGVQASLELADLGPNDEVPMHRYKTGLADMYVEPSESSKRDSIRERVNRWTFDPGRTLLRKEIVLVAYAVTSVYYQTNQDTILFNSMRRTSNYDDGQHSSGRNSGDRRSGRSSGSSQRSRGRHSSDL